jgi:phosphoribosylanthranilate isomerase
MTKIKICGITNKEDALACVKFNVDYIGFIFYKKSPRYIYQKKAKGIIKTIGKEYNNFNTKFVGVFVNEDIYKIIKIIQNCDLGLVQLHGDEDNYYIKKLKKELINNNLRKIKIVKAIRLKNKFNNNFDYDSDYLLFDTFSKEKYGGTGKTFNYDLIKNNLKKINKRFFLSGGLNSNNIETAFKLNPYVLDINSGVEKFPGKKDHKKLREIVEVIKKS